MRYSKSLSRVLMALVAVTGLKASGVEVVTQHFDIARTGANTQETVLTPTNVNTAGFGKLFTVSLNANVNGQVLYVPGLTINSAVHNTCFAYTSNNADGSPCGIYAFDADTGTVLWNRTLTNAAQYTTNTPAIDSAAKIMYFVSKDNNNNGANFLHAVDLLTGAEKPGSPIQVAGSVLGTGAGSSNGQVTFPASHANCRPGILLVGGSIYIGFAFNSDAPPYHGWVMSYTYNGTAFTQTHIFCVSPDKEAGGIWQAGKGLASDGTSIYCTTGNGSFDANIGGSTYGMCVLKFNTSLQVTDWFSPANESAWSNADADLGNCGLTLIPGTTMGFVGSTKYNEGHLVSTTNLGHFSATADTCLQSVTVGGNGSSVGSNPISWKGNANTFVYLHWNGVLSQYQVGTNTITRTHNPSFGSGNGGLCVSSSGTSNGIVWLREGSKLFALNANDVTSELWDSGQNSARDGLASMGKFQFPMVAAGKVYVGTSNAQVVAYGLLNAPPATKLAIGQQPSATSAGASIAPPITVVVQDASGNTATSANNAVTLAIGTNPSAGTLSGTKTVNAVSGVATFSGLNINNPGTGYTLVASASGLTSATTNAFNILSQVATPAIKPNGGSYSGPVTVQLTTATPGSTIRYTTDGSTPTSASTAYTAPFALSASATLKVIAQKAGMTDSAQVSAAFTVTGSTPYGLPYRGVVSGVTLPANLSASPPATLSATGIFSSLATLTPVNGIVPYNVNTPLWSDGAVKTRWTALPGTSQVVFQSTGEWSYPGGTFFVKHFELGTNDTNPAVRKRLETRILYVNATAPNNGYGITYKWRADNSDADLLSASGLDETIVITTATGTRNQVWHYPSQSECLTCHTSVAGFVLGVKTRQLNGTFTYPSTGISDNQLRTWNYLQMFTTNIGEGNIAGFSRSKAIGDTAATLEDRVKSYIDANCAQCHRPGGAVTAFDARYDTPMTAEAIINGAVKTDLGISGAKVVLPKQVSLSMLDVRMHSTTSTTQMPPLARNVVDATACTVIEQWINSLPPNAPTITSFSPTSGPIGSSVTLSGTNFTGATVVKFSGVSATFVVNSDLSITATVPTGAVTGKIAVTVPGGTATSATNFTIIVQPPVIVSPATAAPNPAVSNQAVAFAVNASDPLNGTVSYAWNFGDSVTGTGANVSHTYGTPGTYAAIVTITSSSGGTTTSSVTVTVVASNPTIIPGVNINFQLAGAPIPSGYLADTGAVFGDRGNGYSYGWNADNSANSRDRNAANSPDQRYDTLIHLQKPSNPNAVWEIALPNGTYPVRVVSGDPSYFDSTFKTNVEGVLTVNGQPTSTQKWFQGTQTVTVADGRLTISNAAGAANNKICFVEIGDGTAARDLAELPVADPLTVTQLNLSMNFNKSDSNTYHVSGVLPSLPATFDPTGVNASIDVGAAIGNFILNSKGLGRSSVGAFNLVYKKGKGWLFSATVRKGSWNEVWADGGMVDVDINTKLDIPVTVTLNLQTWGGSKTLTYKAREKKNGIAR